MSVEATGAGAPKRIDLLKVLGPVHVWALGVGIVLVGEFMGWNYGVGKGGAYGALIACWVIGLLYTCVAMIDSENVHAETVGVGHANPPVGCSHRQEAHQRRVE